MSGGVFFFLHCNSKKKTLMYISFSFHFVLYVIFNIKFLFFLGNIEKCPFTFWLNGRWFLQIVDRDSVNLYPIYSLFPKCYDFLSQMWGWFGGGVMFFFHFILFPTFLETNNSGNKKNKNLFF